MGEKAMPRTQYLTRRKGGTYYFRRRVPQGLIPLFKREHIVESLRTSDYREARAKAIQRAAEIDREFQSALSVAAPTTSLPRIEAMSPGEIEKMVDRSFRRDLQRVANLALTLHAHKVEDPCEAASGRDSDRVEMLEMLAAERTSLEWAPASAEPLADRILIEHGFPTREVRMGAVRLRSVPSTDVDKASGKFRLLRDLARRARLKLIEAEMTALNGQSSEAHTGPQQNSIRDRGWYNGRWRFCDLIDAFKKEAARRGRTIKTELDYAMVFRILEEVIGSETFIQEISREHCRQVQNLLDHLPPNATKRFPSLTLTQAAERAKKDGLPTLEPATINSHLHKVSALFNWAVKEERMERNPARGLAGPEGKHRQGARMPFSIEELSKIFSPPLYGTASELQARLAGPTASRFWIPLIALFHGMRLNEICQLRREDITQREGIWVFAVGRGSDQRIKTPSAKRMVPFHPIMHQVDFFGFAARVSGERLFGDLKEDSRGYFSDSFQKWFSRYLVGNCGIRDRKKTFHSFRHTWRDALREAGVSVERVSFLGGWKRTRVDDVWEWTFSHCARWGNFKGRLSWSRSLAHFCVSIIARRCAVQRRTSFRSSATFRDALSEAVAGPFASTKRRPQRARKDYLQNRASGGTFGRQQERYINK